MYVCAHDLRFTEDLYKSTSTLGDKIDRTAIDINDLGAKVWTKMEQEGKRVVRHVLCVCV